MIAWPEKVDHLQRVLPGRTVESLLEGADYWTPRHVVEILACIHGPDSAAARREVILAARQRGITHGPPDLAGHRSRL